MSHEPAYFSKIRFFNNPSAQQGFFSQNARLSRSMSVQILKEFAGVPSLTLDLHITFSPYKIFDFFCTLSLGFVGLSFDTPFAYLIFF